MVKIGVKSDTYKINENEKESHSPNSIVISLIEDENLRNELKKLDKDHDDDIDAHEVLRLKKVELFYRKSAYFLLFVSLILVGVMFGASYGAVELGKEFHTEKDAPREITTDTRRRLNNDAPPSQQNHEDTVHLNEYPTQSLFDLNGHSLGVSGFNDMTVPTGAGASLLKYLVEPYTRRSEDRRRRRQRMRRTLNEDGSFNYENVGEYDYDYDYHNTMGDIPNDLNPMDETLESEVKKDLDLDDVYAVTCDYPYQALAFACPHLRWAPHYTLTTPLDSLHRTIIPMDNELVINYQGDMCGHFAWMDVVVNLMGESEDKLELNFPTQFGFKTIDMTGRCWYEIHMKSPEAIAELKGYEEHREEQFEEFEDYYYDIYGEYPLPPGEMPPYYVYHDDTMFDHYLNQDSEYEMPWDDEYAHPFYDYHDDYDDYHHDYQHGGDYHHDYDQDDSGSDSTIPTGGPTSTTTSTTITESSDNHEASTLTSTTIAESNDPENIITSISSTGSNNPETTMTGSNNPETTTMTGSNNPETTMTGSNNPEPPTTESSDEFESTSSVTNPESANYSPPPSSSHDDDPGMNNYSNDAYEDHDESSSQPTHLSPPTDSSYSDEIVNSNDLYYHNDDNDEFNNYNSNELYDHNDNNNDEFNNYNSNDPDFHESATNNDPEDYASNHSNDPQNHGSNTELPTPPYNPSENEGSESNDSENNYYNSEEI